MKRGNGHIKWCWMPRHMLHSVIRFFWSILVWRKFFPSIGKRHMMVGNFMSWVLWWVNPWVGLEWLGHYFSFVYTYACVCELFDKRVSIPYMISESRIPISWSANKLLTDLISFANRDIYIFFSNMATSELYTLLVNIGALWWYLITISVLLELLCEHCKTSR